jgi:hypothetical protein
VATNMGRVHYLLRQETAKPVFGINKEALGFRCIRLRGVGNSAME